MTVPTYNSGGTARDVEGGRGDGSHPRDSHLEHQLQRPRPAHSLRLQRSDDHAVAHEPRGHVRGDIPVRPLHLPPDPGDDEPRGPVGAVSAAVLQALVYTYDPVGNVVETDDNADSTPVFGTAITLFRQASTATTRSTALSPPRGASTRASSSRPAPSRSPTSTSPSPQRLAGAGPVHRELHLRPGRQHSEDRCTRQLAPRRA